MKPAKNQRIMAECHSDDYCVEVEFDATQWFVQATDADIIELAQCEWGGDYPADRVAEFFEKTTTKELFDYLGVVRNKQYETIGFECHVNIKDAIAWIIQHRPELYVRHHRLFSQHLTSPKNPVKVKA